MNRVARCFRCLSTFVFTLVPGLLAAAPLAWISNNGSNNISVIDTATDTIGAPISLVPLPRAVAVSPTHVFVTHDNDTLSIINKTTRMVATKTLPSSALVGVAASPNGSRVYVSGYGTNQLFVVDTTNNNAIIATLPVSKPFGIAVKPDGSRAYVAYDDGISARVAVLDTTTNTLLPPIALSGREPTGIAISPDGTRLFVCVTATDRVVIVNLDTMTTSTLNVGGEPRGVVVNHAGTRAYFSEYMTSQVGVINTSTGLVIDHFSSGGNGPWGIDVSADDSRVYVANHDSHNIGIRNVTTNSAITRSVGTSPIAFGRFIDAYVPPTQVPPELGDVPNQNGTAGVTFSLDLANYVTTTNADPIQSYDIVSGALPDGLSLDTASGLISGTPLLAGRGASITLNVSDDDGASTSDTIAFTIAPPAGAAPFDVMVPSANPSVRGFSQALNGNVAPSRILSGANTQLVVPVSLTYEPTEDELYVGDFSGRAVRIFPADAQGDSAPKRVLDVTNYGQPRTLAVDTLHDELVVAGSGCFPCTWTRTDSGAPAPLRRLGWGGNTATQGNIPVAVALDPANDLMFIGDSDSAAPYTGKVLIFPRTANGDVAPSRIIKGPTSRIGAGSPYLAFDPVTRQLFVLTSNIDPVNTNIRHVRIVVFHANDNGDVAPLRTIEGSTTQLDISATDLPYGLSYDPSTHRLLVSIYSNTATSNRVLAFYAGDTGNVAPIVNIGGTNTGLDKISRAAVVPMNRLFRNGFE